MLSTRARPLPPDDNALPTPGRTPALIAARTPTAEPPKIETAPGFLAFIASDPDLRARIQRALALPPEDFRAEVEALRAAYENRPSDAEAGDA